ncbi:hypothetical protein GCM10023159_12090 [Brevibacterium yomogidense]
MAVEQRGRGIGLEPGDEAARIRLMDRHPARTRAQTPLVDDSDEEGERLQVRQIDRSRMPAVDPMLR